MQFNECHEVIWLRDDHRSDIVDGTTLLERREVQHGVGIAGVVPDGVLFLLNLHHESLWHAEEPLLFTACILLAAFGTSSGVDHVFCALIFSHE